MYIVYIIAYALLLTRLVVIQSYRKQNSAFSQGLLYPFFLRAYSTHSCHCTIREDHVYLQSRRKAKTHPSVKSSSTHFFFYPHPTAFSGPRGDAISVSSEQVDYLYSTQTLVPVVQGRPYLVPRLYQDAENCVPSADSAAVICGAVGERGLTVYIVGVACAEVKGSNGGDGEENRLG